MKNIFIFILTLGLTYLSIGEVKAQCATTPITYSLVAQPGGTVDVFVTSSQMIPNTPGTTSPSSAIILKFPTGGNLGAINFTPDQNRWALAKIDVAPSCSPGFDYLVANATTTFAPNFVPGVPQLAFTFTPPGPPCVGGIEVMTNADPYATTAGCGTGDVSTRINQFTIFSIPTFLGCSAYGGNMGNPVSCDPFAPLPVELLNFTAKKFEEESHLEWSTATEIDNKGFTIQRSIDGRSWEEIGWESGAGTYDQVSSYSFIDRHPVNGINYYRLEQVDFDGRTSLTDIRAVEFEAESISLKAFPNPTDGPVTLSIGSGEDEVIYYRITDVTGKTVLERSNQSAPGGKYELELSYLPAGVYQLTASHSGGQGNISLVIVER